MHQFSQSLIDFCSHATSLYENEPILREIYSVLSSGSLDVNKIEDVLKSNHFANFKEIKPLVLKSLIDYANHILEDGIISDAELSDFTMLKKLFKIKEGDFIRYLKFEITEILKKEFIRIFSDNYVSEKEQLLSLNLQSLFDLSYDEFENFKKDEIIQALLRGANPVDLEIAKIPRDFKF